MRLFSFFQNSQSLINNSECNDSVLYLHSFCPSGGGWVGGRYLHGRNKTEELLFPEQAFDLTQGRQECWPL